MKKIIFRALLLLGNAAFGSCSEQLETDVFNFSENTVRFTDEGGTQTLIIEVKCDCTLSCDADWIDYTPQYIEAGRSELTIEATENPMFEARETTILLANEELDITHTIAIRQAGIATYINCDNELTATYKGGILAIEVQSNVPWEASSQADWLTLSPTRGAVGTTELTVELPMLTADQKTRQGEIVLSNADYDIKTTITVKQTSQSAFLACSPDRITASFAGGEFSIDLETNIPLGTDIPWKVSCDADWLTAVPERENIRINISEWRNTGIRKTEVVVSNAEYNITKKIAVEQSEMHENQIITYTAQYSLRISIEESAFDAALFRHEYNTTTRTGTLIFDRAVTTIGEDAFHGCTGLTGITLPNSVTTIGSSAFYNCSSLTSITIPNRVTEIRESTFSGCSSLTSITIPDSVTEIGDYAFSTCSSLTNVTIGNSVTEIGSYAFARCTNLTRITIPDSVTEIGNYAFNTCSSLTNVTIGNGVATIGERAFWQCGSLRDVTFGNGVKTIGYSAFSYCKSLISITIPDSVTTIGGYAFSYCSSLISFTIGKKVTSIEDYAFSDCSALTYLYSKPTTPPTLGVSVLNEFGSSDKIYVPTAYVDAYKKADVWCYRAKIIFGLNF